MTCVINGLVWQRPGEKPFQCRLRTWTCA